MPRYYRHIRHGDELIEDPEGIDLPDLETARTEVIQGVRDILADAVRRGSDDMLDDVIELTDETGRILTTIPFMDALPPRLRGAHSAGSAMDRPHPSPHNDDGIPG